MPKLVLTNPKGKERTTMLVSAANAPRANDQQTHELEQINRRLSPEILGELAKRGLTIPAHEYALLLSYLKTHEEWQIAIAD